MDRAVTPNLHYLHARISQRSRTLIYRYRRVFICMYDIANVRSENFQAETFVNEYREREKEAETEKTDAGVAIATRKFWAQYMLYHCCSLSS